LVRRVCVIGAESTGKTTLAAALSRELDAPMVHEFGRHYSEAMPDATRYRWTDDDFRAIAGAQDRFEDDAARWAGPLLICDTNSFVTVVFQEAYLGRSSPEIDAAARSRHYDLFLLCDPETPFAPDVTGLRRDGGQRQWMHERYVDYLADQATPHVLVAGDPARRLRVATGAVAQRNAHGWPARHNGALSG